MDTVRIVVAALLMTVSLILVVALGLAACNMERERKPAHIHMGSAR